MKHQRTVELACQVPKEASYRKHFVPEGQWSDDETFLATARTAPDFAARFVAAFAEMRQPLPAGIDEPELLRGYVHLRFATGDSDTAAAFALEQQIDRLRTVYIRCLLLRPDHSYAAIARKTGYSEKTLRIYQTLYWPVRDCEELFTMSLLYPESRQCELQPDYLRNESVENLAYRVAYNEGIEPVEILLGLRNESTAQEEGEDEIMEPKLEAEARKLAYRFLGNANYLLSLGPGSQSLPEVKEAIGLAKTILSRHKNGDAAEKRHLPDAVAVRQSIAAACQVEDRAMRPRKHAPKRSQKLHRKRFGIAVKTELQGGALEVAA